MGPESIDAGDALQIAADYLGSETSANVLARHWFNSQRPGDIVAMAEHLLALHHRLVRPQPPPTGPARPARRPPGTIPR